MPRRQRRTTQRHPSGTQAHGPAHTWRSWTVGALPIVNHFLTRLRLEELLTAQLPTRDGRGRLPVARAVCVLVQNLLLAREPLYGLGEGAALQAPHHLGLTSTQIGSLNDDRLGRTLATLFQVGPAAVLLALVQHMVQAFAVSLQALHNDSTTSSFYGA